MLGTMAVTKKEARQQYFIASIHAVVAELVYVGDLALISQRGQLLQSPATGTIIYIDHIK